MNVALDRPAFNVNEVDNVYWVEFDRPEANNALTEADYDAIRELVESVSGKARAMVFTGAGAKSFSSGMHLATASSLNATTALEVIGSNRDVFTAIRTAPFATIAGINGYCLGAGFGVALVCDIRIASTNAVFGLPELKLGVPCVCDIALLSQYIGLAKAKEMILTAENVSAAEMLGAGLLNRVVPQEELISAITYMVGLLTSHTATVVAAQKRIFEMWQNASLRDAIDYSVEVWAGTYSDPATLAHIMRRKASISQT
jgi:enoyl-CoA hydratase/carnithine racemase